MSLSVNFNPHSKALSSTYQAVLNGDKDTSWVVYGYDKGGNDLKVLEKGGEDIIIFLESFLMSNLLLIEALFFWTMTLAGGLDELVEEFDDGKIQYAFVRVIDPNTELPKFVLIGWVCIFDNFNAYILFIFKFLPFTTLFLNLSSVVKEYRKEKKDCLIHTLMKFQTS